MKQELTERQSRVYEAIKSHIKQHGYAPTVRELMRTLEIKSPNGVVCHLDALKKKGWINGTPHKSRAITLVESPETLPTVDGSESEDFGDFFADGNKVVKHPGGVFAVFNAAGEAIGTIRRVSP